jgi:hypothetical protein
LPRESGARTLLPSFACLNLRIEPSVSEPDFTNTVQISGTVVPTFTVRNTRTTVELRDGQSFATSSIPQILRSSIISSSSTPATALSNGRRSLRRAAAGAAALRLPSRGGRIHVNPWCGSCAAPSMIPKSGRRFSEKIMLKQKVKSEVPNRSKIISL